MDTGRSLMVQVDSNVLLDLFTDDSQWAQLSAEKLSACAGRRLAIKSIVFAELSPVFRAESELEKSLSGWPFEKLRLPYRAAPGFLHRRSGSCGKSNPSDQRRTAISHVFSRRAVDRSRVTSADGFDSASNSSVAGQTGC